MITDPPENLAVREALSPLQRTQILNELLKHEQGHKTPGTVFEAPHAVTLTDNPVPRKSYELDHHGSNRQPGVRFKRWTKKTNPGSMKSSPKISFRKHVPWSNKIDDTTYSMPSKTLAYAYQDTTTSLHQGKPRNSMNDYTSADLMESRGRALQPVEQALFGKARWAKDRIHWTFPPEKDERVSLLLSWIEKCRVSSVLLEYVLVMLDLWTRLTRLSSFINSCSRENVGHSSSMPVFVYRNFLTNLS